MAQLCNDLGCEEIFAENATGSMNTCQSDCTIINSSLYNCAKAVSENCSSLIEIVCEWQAVQLIGGKDRCAGRVELFGTGGWGTVCDDGWDLNGGNVVCAQLGCGTALRVMGENGDFDPGSGPIYISHLNCSGTEKNLWQCTGLQKDRNYCGHKEDAAVVCSGSSYTPLTTIKTFTTDLTNWTTGGIEIRRASQVSQQGNSHTSNNSNYERSHNPNSPPPATANNCEHMVAQFHPEYCIKMTPLNNTSEAAKKYSPVAADSFDSESTSSEECYENIGTDAETCLQTYDSSTSSEEAYEIVAEIEENCFAGSERTAHSSSDSDYDDVCNW
ncbi:antigen WC1.1-like [Silurus asotus]|uniref:Antigen WC1.1-like n=1 Tax=Silurus asotus TaxID=30991 RepID=A0AAD4ZZ75_SILAS|nr:antigen WC1.1-like [Silurus asotus]